MCDCVPRVCIYMYVCVSTHNEPSTNQVARPTTRSQQGNRKKVKSHTARQASEKRRKKGTRKKNEIRGEGGPRKGTQGTQV